jgi:SAM-dependent methyltransferase
MAALGRSSARSATAEQFDRWLDRYARDEAPIGVNFRALVTELVSVDRATHLIHPYPAKLLAQIPYFFLRYTKLSRSGDRVLDPFCGSGTVLLESLLLGRRALGADANPLARLISRVKTSASDPAALRTAARRLLARVPATTDLEPPDVVNLAYWYTPSVVRQLNRIRVAVMRTRDPAARDFFAVTFSACARRVSLADPRLSVPVRLRPERYAPDHWLAARSRARLQELQRCDVLGVFAGLLEQNLRRLAALGAALPRNAKLDAVPISHDARRLLDDEDKALADGAVQLVLTSPPYVGAQKYVRASSLSIGWLSLAGARGLRALEDRNIGREHFTAWTALAVPSTGVPAADRMLRDIRRENPLRAHIAATYLVEMREALRESSRVLAPGGHMVLVAANNTVCGREFRTQAYLRSIAEQLGLTTRLRLTDDIRSRGLMTRRNTTASIIGREWVHVYQKPR